MLRGFESGFISNMQSFAIKLEKIENVVDDQMTEMFMSQFKSVPGHIWYSIL